MSKGAYVILHNRITLAISWQEKKTPFWKTILISGQPQYLINCKPVYEFKDGAQTSLRKACSRISTHFRFLLAISVEKAQ